MCNVFKIVQFNILANNLLYTKLFAEQTKPAILVELNLNFQLKLTKIIISNGYFKHLKFRKKNPSKKYEITNKKNTFICVAFGLALFVKIQKLTLTALANQATIFR
jgi:hypothetical protein